MKQNSFSSKIFIVFHNIVIGKLTDKLKEKYEENRIETWGDQVTIHLVILTSLRVHPITMVWTEKTKRIFKIVFTVLCFDMRFQSILAGIMIPTKQ